LESPQSIAFQPHEIDFAHRQVPEILFHSVETVYVILVRPFLFGMETDVTINHVKKVKRRGTVEDFALLMLSSRLMVHR
jgi:hypothetical protein